MFRLVKPEYRASAKGTEDGISWNALPLVCTKDKSVQIARDIQLRRQGDSRQGRRRETAEHHVGGISEGRERPKPEYRISTLHGAARTSVKSGKELSLQRSLGKGTEEKSDRESPST